jgi:hypothetical protein
MYENQATYAGRRPIANSIRGTAYTERVLVVPVIPVIKIIEPMYETQATYAGRRPIAKSVRGTASTERVLVVPVIPRPVGSRKLSKKLWPQQLHNSSRVVPPGKFILPNS